MVGPLPHGFNGAGAGTTAGGLRGAVRRSKKAMLRARISAALSDFVMLGFLPEAITEVEVGGTGSDKRRRRGTCLIGNIQVV